MKRQSHMQVPHSCCIPWYPILRFCILGFGLKQMSQWKAIHIGTLLFFCRAKSGLITFHFYHCHCILLLLSYSSSLSTLITPYRRVSYSFRSYNCSLHFWDPMAILLMFRDSIISPYQSNRIFAIPISTFAEWCL